MREPLKLVALGGTGTGKTTETFEFLTNYVCGPKVKQPRNILIFDTNMEKEFKSIAPLKVQDIPKFNIQKKKEIRKILPIDYANGHELNEDEKFELLKSIIVKYQFFNGVLLVEDPDKFVSSANTKAFKNLLTTNRHKGLDIIMHYQSWGAVPTNIWRNINIIRVHQTIDGPNKSKIQNEFSDTNILHIAHYLLKEMLQTNIRSSVHINMNTFKLTGKFTNDNWKKAIAKYCLATPPGKSKLKEIKAINKIKDDDAAIQKIIYILAKDYLILK